MNATTTRPAVSIDELKRAWAAVQAGDFRRDQPRTSLTPTTKPPVVATEWIPAAGERTIVVIGAAGSVGATSVALALGMVAEGPARVVECCSGTVSGTAAATTAELGLHESGWRQGKRDQLLLERRCEPLIHADQVDVPAPTIAGHRVTILDLGWDLAQVLATSCWLNDAVRSADAVVVVGAATVPGMRRLEATLELLGHDRAVLAILGPHRKKWAKAVDPSAGPAVRRALDAGRYIPIPEDRVLAATGLDSRPLPAPLIEAARQLSGRLNLNTPLPADD